jgi:hypothetical protein
MTHPINLHREPGLLRSVLEAFPAVACGTTCMNGIVAPLTAEELPSSQVWQTSPGGLDWADYSEVASSSRILSSASITADG